MRRWLKYLPPFGGTPAPEGPTVSSPKAAPNNQDLHEVQAVYAVRAAMTFKSWIHHRTDTVSFPDAEVVCRESTLDFTLPTMESYLQDRTTVFVPIHILDRADTSFVELSDADGKELPMLTRQESEEIARLGLEAVLAPRWEHGSVRLERLLKQVVETYPADGEPAQSSQREDEIKESRKRAKEELFSLLETVEDGLQGLVKGLLQELSDGFLLLVPMSYEPQLRQLLSFSYSPGKYSGAKKGGGGIYRPINRFLSSIGFAARQEELERLPVGWASSYYIEAIPPEDMWFAEATLRSGKMTEVCKSPQRPHFRPVGWRDSAQLTLLLSPRRDSLIVPLFFSTAVIAGALAFVPEQICELDPQVLGGLLLLPFALVAYYFRGSEHRYLTLILRGVRLLAGVPVLAAIVVLALLGLHLLEHHSQAGDTAFEVAAWAARIAVLASVLLLPALIMPTLSKPVRKWVRRAQGAAEDRQIPGRHLLGIVLAVALALLGAAVFSAVCVAIYLFVPF